MTDEKPLEQLQAEGRQRLRDLQTAREHQRQKLAESNTEIRKRRAERWARFRKVFVQVFVQTSGTVLGGAVLALAGLAFGLIQSTPRAQVFSAVGLVLSLLLSISGAVVVGRTAARTDRRQDEDAGERAYLARVAEISTEYKLSEEPGAIDDEQPR